MELDILHINIRSNSEWFGGGKEQLGAIRLETITLDVSNVFTYNLVILYIHLFTRRLEVWCFSKVTFVEFLDT